MAFGGLVVLNNNNNNFESSSTSAISIMKGTADISRSSSTLVGAGGSSEQPRTTTVIISRTPAPQALLDRTTMASSISAIGVPTTPIEEKKLVEAEQESVVDGKSMDKISLVEFLTQKQRDTSAEDHKAIAQIIEMVESDDELGVEEETTTSNTELTVTEKKIPTSSLVEFLTKKPESEKPNMMVEWRITIIRPPPPSSLQLARRLIWHPSMRYLLVLAKRPGTNHNHCSCPL